MKKHEFSLILNSVKASDIHKFYSVDAGFVAVTSHNPMIGRTVIREDDPYEMGIQILKHYNIKILYGKENNC